MHVGTQSILPRERVDESYMITDININIYIVANLRGPDQIPDSKQSATLVG